MNQSIVQQRGQVPFPIFTGERIYMREFTKSAGLPSDLRRWQETVDAMLDGIDAPGPIFMMVDQGCVQPGTSHRRPGLHIDGYWHPTLRAHGGGYVGSWDTGRWTHCDFSTPEALILASDVAASRAFVGEWEGSPNEGGDCSHIATSGLRELHLEANVVYAGNVTMLHESLPIPCGGKRTLVRLNVPGWTPNEQN